MHADSGGGFEDDAVAEGLQLADVVTLGALSIEAGVVKADPKVAADRNGQRYALNQPTGMRS
jgi:hypothetical protein